MNKKILIIGANGMLGGSLFRYFTDSTMYSVIGTVRSNEAKEFFEAKQYTNIVSGIDVSNKISLRAIIMDLQPDYIFNCVGIIKQLDSSKNHILSININSLLPHELAAMASEVKAKLIHFSTDCVFSGKKGGYSENDIPDATDIYGRSKLLGEVDYNGHLTLRTSIIGHEYDSNHSLVDWFLSQDGTVNGFSHAIFSGLPTVYLAEVLDKFILPKKNLSGLYHLSVEPIDKYTLLTIINNIYERKNTIVENKEFTIDRSLNSSCLSGVIGFKPESWFDLIKKMHCEYVRYFK
ncbi:dTDP-4-dehydrorhamnose reductase [Yersinia massiliensis]|uniref:dTDP-4-dehydrorhamnose reductase family protein n=1 Tax=Yersinia massiliensis TaxID=419257 RepID=UPI0005E516F6|nr:SDR family oxidoreductase [Yersinia massiliensis]CNH66580.1 dTDP-4-dehydrorhamnose reductase [Yersinia massiliensis]